MTSAVPESTAVVEGPYMRCLFCDEVFDCAGHDCPAAIAWDTYLREFVEVCERDEDLDVVVCRRIWPVPSGMQGGWMESDGVMMPLPIGYFVPVTPLARELMVVRR